MYKYKLVRRVNPKDKSAPKKWYATPMSELPQKVKVMTRAATANTTIAPKEMEVVLELLGNYAREQLLQGHSMRIGDLGILRITFQSEGVEDLTKYNASRMIKNPRILFVPSKEFRESVINNLQFENAGVLDDKINYASIVDYKKAKGIMDAGGSSAHKPGGEVEDGGK